MCLKPSLASLFPEKLPHLAMGSPLLERSVVKWLLWRSIVCLDTREAARRA
jgi:hypothetical protein